jgi:hypothetical protein
MLEWIPIPACQTSEITSKESVEGADVVLLGVRRLLCVRNHAEPDVTVEHRAR